MAREVVTGYCWPQSVGAGEQVGLHMSSAAGRPVVERPVVGGVRVSEPDDGVAEVAAVVHRRHRVQAIALRLEGRDGRWVVTVLQCG